MIVPTFGYKIFTKRYKEYIIELRVPMALLFNKIDQNFSFDLEVIKTQIKDYENTQCLKLQ